MLIEWCGEYQIDHNPVLANFADIIGLDVSVNDAATVQVQVVSARLCKKGITSVCACAAAPLPRSS